MTTTTNDADGGMDQTMSDKNPSTLPSMEAGKAVPKLKLTFRLPTPPLSSSGQQQPSAEKPPSTSSGTGEILPTKPPAKKARGPAAPTNSNKGASKKTALPSKTAPATVVTPSAVVPEAPTTK